MGSRPQSAGRPTAAGPRPGGPGKAGGSAVTRRVVRRKQKSRSSGVETATPGPRLRSRSTPGQVRETSDPILRTAGPPAHTHVPGEAGVTHGSGMVSGWRRGSVNPVHRTATLSRAARRPARDRQPGDVGSWDDSHPGSLPGLRRREDRRPRRARRPRLRRGRISRPARSRSASPGRASTTRTAWRRARTARSPGSAR